MSKKVSETASSGDNRVFISYSRKDKDQVFAIVEWLQKSLGIKCWIDINGIESGQQFEDKIMGAIERAEVVIFMMSENSLASEYARKEVKYADIQKKRIVPVILDGEELRGWFAFNFSMTDFKIASNPEHMAKLLEDLSSWLSLKIKDPVAFAGQAQVAESQYVNLKVLSNLECKVVIDCEEKAVAPAGSLTKIPLLPGEYYAEFISTENAAYAITREITLERDKIEKVDLLCLRQAQVQAVKSSNQKRKSAPKPVKTKVIESALSAEERSRIDKMTLVPYISGNLCGFADLATGEKVIPAKYEQVGKFADGLAMVYNHNCSKVGLINRYGDEILPCKHKLIQFVGEDRLAVKKGSRWALMDYKGNELVSFIYTYLGTAFKEGLLLAKSEGGCWGFINTSGDQVIECEYDVCCDFSEGFAAVKKDGKWGYISYTGDIVIPFMYDWAREFNEGAAPIVVNDRWGFVDKSGKVIIPPKYESAGRFFNGYAKVRMNSKWGIIDRRGSEVVPCIYYLGSGAENKENVEVQYNCQSGYIDYSGRVLIPCRYSELGLYFDGLATVKSNGKYGFLDETGKQVISSVYDLAFSFEDGFAQVKINDKWGCIDKSGRQVIPCRYEELGSFSKYGFAIAKMNGKYGLIDRKTNVVIPFKYDSMIVHDELYLVELDDRRGYVDLFGTENWCYVIKRR